MAYFTHINKEKTPLKADTLIEIAKVSAPILKAVVEKGIFEEYYLQKDRVSFADDETSTERKLTTAQQTTLASLKQQFTEKKTVLLQGVPASGKTELYISLIKRMLRERATSTIPTARNRTNSPPNQSIKKALWATPIGIPF